MSASAFYVLRNSVCADGSTFDFVTEGWTETGEAPNCSACGRFTDMRPLVPPMKGRLEADRYFDLAKMLGTDVLITQRCSDIFQSANISGLFDLRPVEIVDLNGTADPLSVPQYSVGRVNIGGAIDRGASDLKTSETSACAECGYSGLIESYERIVVAAHTWEGADFFSLKGLPGVLLITPRVIELCNVNRLSVCSVLSAAECSMNRTIGTA